MESTFNAKEKIKSDFQNLLKNHQQKAQQIVTKEEVLKLEQNKVLLEKAAQYTPASIVKGLADLQLQFSSAVESLATDVQSEVSKLAELKQAIQVQKAQLQESVDTKIAANMLDILKKEQEQAEKTLQSEIEQEQQQHDEVVTTQRATWEKEKAAFAVEQQEYSTRLEKNRTTELEEYRYQLERTYKIEQDQYETDKELLTRQLAEQNTAKEKDWKKREQVLVEQAEELEKYKQKVDGFEEEFKEKVDAARKKAIDTANRDAKEAAALYEKEVEGAKLVSDLEIAALETTIVDQKEQIEQLSADLKEALDKVANLSLKALENSSARLN